MDFSFFSSKKWRREGRAPSITPASQQPWEGEEKEMGKAQGSCSLLNSLREPPRQPGRALLAQTFRSQPQMLKRNRPGFPLLVLWSRAGPVANFVFQSLLPGDWREVWKGLGPQIKIEQRFSPQGKSDRRGISFCFYCLFCAKHCTNICLLTLLNTAPFSR